MADWGTLLNSRLRGRRVAVILEEHRLKPVPPKQKRQPLAAVSWISP